MKPYVVCHMLASLDGRLHPSRFTDSPDGRRSDWSAAYEEIHESLKGDAWLVGRVTMAEMAKAGPHAPDVAGPVARPCHIADRKAEVYAVALDPSGKLHFQGGAMNGDSIVVLLGAGVPDSHLAELAGDGVSYIVSNKAEIDLRAALETLNRELGIKRLLLEGGARINGSFFAAGLVDEFSLLVAPALDARPASEAIVDAGAAGLAGKARLSLQSCEPRAHGLVHLRYRVEA